jgi:hypothetical protein
MFIESGTIKNPTKVKNTICRIIIVLKEGLLLTLLSMMCLKLIYSLVLKSFIILLLQELI